MHDPTSGQKTPVPPPDPRHTDGGPLPQPAEGVPAVEPNTVLPSDAPVSGPKEDDSYPTRMSEAPFDMAAWADLNG